MRNCKKVTKCLLTSSLAALLFASSTVTADVSAGSEGDRETFTIAIVRIDGVTATDFFEDGFFKELEDKLNVDIQWQTYFASEWAEKKSTMFISGDLPDAFYGSLTTNDSDYILNEEYFVELTDLIQENMPNYSSILEEDAALRYRGLLADGRCYTLTSRMPFQSDVDRVLFINQTWLDNLGLDMPETYEDLKEVLLAFKEQDANGNGDPTDEIPYSSLMSFGFDLTTIAESFGAGTNGLFGLDENRELIFIPTQEKYKNAVMWLHELYQNGLMDPEGYTEDASMYYSKNQADGGCRVGLVEGYDITTEVGQYADEFVVMPPLSGPDGDKNVYYNPAGRDINNNELAITTSCSNPAKLLQWADEFYTDDIAIQAFVGAYGVGCEKREDGSYYVYKDPDALFAWNHTTHVLGPKWMTREGQDNTEFEEGYSGEKLLKAWAVYEPYLRDYNCSAPTMKFTEEQTDILSELQGDIASYVSQKHAHWVTEGGIEEEWNDFIAQLERMDLQRYIEVYEEAYENYLSVIG